VSCAKEEVCVRKLVLYSACAGAVIVVGAMVAEGGFGPAVIGALAGTAGSFAIFGLRIRSIRNILAGESRREAGRTAFLHSIGKLLCAFAALSIGALAGAAGAVGALAGLLSTHVAVAAGVVLGTLRSE